MAVTSTARRALAVSLGQGGTALADEILDAVDRGDIDNLGAATTGVTATEDGIADLHVTTLSLSAVSVTITDTGGANGGYGTKKLYDFPAGLIKIHGVTMSLACTAAAGISATGTLKASLGTTAEATNDTLDGVQADIVPSSSVVLSSSAGTITGKSYSAITTLTDSTSGTADGTLEACADLSTSDTYTDAAVNAKLAILRNWAADLASKVNALILNGANGREPVLDGTSTAIDLILNFGVANADISSNSTVTVTGTVKVVWSFAGDV